MEPAESSILCEIARFSNSSAENELRSSVYVSTNISKLLRVENNSLQICSTMGMNASLELRGKTAHLRGAMDAGIDKY